ncbi:hypothetical protein [Ruegeria arenilitoris]|uniref:hypothetical protein n=1 Tax=Ruegeria arenilitoris TaxID=1173585 RepID=UPI00147C77A6|nr:hypothetical protein [Ruegeria arenilitoris]
MSRKLLSVSIVIALIVGVVYRVFPIFAGDDALAQFFITEDGYLMLTIARNMAIGLGMSVSEGTIVTNGVQPLATFIFTIPYVLTDGDKLDSLVGVILISTLIAVAAFFVLQRFAHLVLRQFTDDPIWSWLVAAFWFVGPLLLFHSMNALETGLYTLIILLTLLQFSRVLNKGADSTFADRMFLGALCGITFLARIDGALLVVAIFLVWGLFEFLALRIKFFTVVGRLFTPGLLSLVFAAPWLIYNQLLFGRITPISGISQSHGANFGSNLSLLPSKLIEYVFPMLPVPTALEQTSPSIVIFALIIVVVLGLFVTSVWRTGSRIRLVVLAYLIFGFFLATYYGLFFGAPHFISRYMAPLSPVLITATVVVGLNIVTWSRGRISQPVLQYLGVAGLALSLALLGRLAIPGVKEQGHFQVVEWVQENVPQDIWVGAVQTGTLGYWRDRTINLDGKVNPNALRALKEQGDVLNYVLGSEIQFIADWSDVADWPIEERFRDTEFARRFEVVIKDEAADLGVLRRTSYSDS